VNLPTPCCDASRMAYLYAMRRDWGRQTMPWLPWMGEALFMIAIEIDAEARGGQEPNPFEEKS
jgi:hypothetical protein